MNRNALMSSTRCFAPADPPAGGGAAAPEASATPAPAPAPAPSPAPAPAPAPAVDAAVAEPAASPSPAPAEGAEAKTEGAAAAVAEGAAAKPEEGGVKSHTETPSLMSEAGKPAEGEKPGEAAAAAVVDPAAAQPAPVEYKFTVPEGVIADQKTLTDFGAFLGEHKIAPEVGQALVDRHVAEMQKAASSMLQQQHDAFGAMRAGWRKELMENEQLGGSGFETTKANVAEMRDLFVSKEDLPAFNKMLDTTGVGDHPEFWKMMNNVARRFKEPAPLPADLAKPPKDAGKNPSSGKRGSMYDHPSSAKMAGG